MKEAQNAGKMVSVEFKGTDNGSGVQRWTSTANKSRLNNSGKVRASFFASSVLETLEKSMVSTVLFYYFLLFLLFFFLFLLPL